MYYTDDPVRDFLCHDAKQADELDRLPKCAECGKPIQSEKCYESYEKGGDVICQECLENNHTHWVEDYVG